MPRPDAPYASSGGSSRVTFTFDHALKEVEVEQLKLATGAHAAVTVPSPVRAAYAREKELGFTKSSAPEVGQLLSVLAATVAPHGRVLELGTGAGVGLAWIVNGVGRRNDVEVVSVELNGEQAALVQAAGWPDWVSIIVGDGAKLVETLGTFDLIFPDIPGKVYGLREAIAALRPGGLLLVDDMGRSPHDDPERCARLASVRDQLGEPPLICTELAFSSGMILAARQRS